jgi:putative ABC transport system permease protein
METEEPGHGSGGKRGGIGVLVMVREAVTMAVASLRAHHVRAALTAGGVIMGVAAIIVLVGLGQGVRTSFDRRFGPLTTQIEVKPQTGSQGPGPGRAKNLTLADVHALVAASSGPDIAAVTPVVTGTALIRSDSRSYPVSLAGSTINYLTVTNRSLVAGRAFTDREDRIHARVAVLGSGVAQSLFGPDPHAALSRPVRIGRLDFSVIGVLDSNGQDDSVALMPSDAARDLVGGVDTVGKIIVTAADPATVTPAFDEVNRILLVRHHIENPVETDFTVTARRDLVASATRWRDGFGLFVLAMAGISLIVGAVGIANVMLVSVTERTTEIGIRRAVGASRRAITLQFLTESAVISGIGGICGVAVGVVTTLGAALVLPSGESSARFGTPQISLAAVVVGFAVSVAIGVVAGLYPARRAARVPPIEALRSE